MRGANTAALPEPAARDVRVTEAEITAELSDGRNDQRSARLVLAPLGRDAGAANNFRLIGGGEGIHWPDIDEDISVRGMLDGVPARR